jgi:hypothetical protein
MIEAIGYMFIGAFFAMLIPALQAWAESKTKDKNVPKA